MTTQTIYQTALVVHITGLTIMAGTTLADYVIFKKFWKQFAADKAGAAIIYKAMSGFAMLFGIGFILLLVSGVTMMAITHGAFGEQLWFRIKFGLIIIIILNGILLGRRQGVKLRHYLSGELPGANTGQSLLQVKRNIIFFHFLQIAIFISIYILSVFKFN